MVPADGARRIRRPLRDPRDAALHAGARTLSAEIATARHSRWREVVGSGKLRIEKVGTAGYVTVAVFVVLLLRASTLFGLPQLMWEEPGAFYAAAHVEPIGSLIAPWNGFQELGLRLAYIAFAALPGTLVPAASLVTFYAIVGLVAGFLASDRMVDAIPSRGVRVAFAMSLAVLPGSPEPLSSILNASWYVALFLIALPLARPARHPWLERGALALGSLTGGVSILVAPLYWLRIRDHRLRPPIAIITVGALVQAATYVLADHPRAIAIDAASAPTTLIERFAYGLVGIALGQIGFLATALGLIVIAFVVASRRALPAATFATFATCGLAIAVLGVATGFTFTGALGPTRYYLPLTAFVILVIAAAIHHSRPATALALAVLLAIGIGAEFVLPRPPDVDWPGGVACIASDGGCVVRGYPEDWLFTWPGRAAYRIPASEVDALWSR